MVRLRKPRTTAGEVLRDALMSVQRRAHVERRIVCTRSWLAPQDVHPWVQREGLKRRVAHGNRLLFCCNNSFFFR